MEVLKKQNDETVGSSRSDEESYKLNEDLYLKK
jgi:hypothetical protein